jgi:hypothetical protein
MALRVHVLDLRTKGAGRLEEAESDRPAMKRIRRNRLRITFLDSSETMLVSQLIEKHLALITFDVGTVNHQPI